MNNKEVAQKFSLLGKLMDVYGENPFKARSYSSAAFTIKQLPQNIMDIPKDELFKLPGIGTAIGNKILEIRENGSIRILDDLLEKTPPGILELISIKGIGAKKIHEIWSTLEIEDPAGLLYACGENRLIKLPGFGKKTQDNIAAAIEFYLDGKGSFLYRQVEEYAYDLEKELAQLFAPSLVQLTGDVRRNMEVISRIEFVTDLDAGEIKKRIASRLNSLSFIETVSDHVVKFHNEKQFEIIFHTARKNNFVQRFFETTGSDIFVTEFYKRFPKIDFTTCTSEEDIFKHLHIQVIPSYLRDDAGIIDLAKKNKIPAVIEFEDIKGLIHCHTKWSDGTATIEEMAKGCIARKLEYMVLSDHSKAAFYAQGLTEDKIIEQHALVDKLNQQLAPFRIFKSIECDILSDGSLDYDEKILQSFDLVIASVHSNLKMSKEKATERLLTAIANPFTTILGHMTGRLLLSREGYEVDHNKIINACAAYDVVIEINANPRRLDMRWQWIPLALSKGVLLSIDPDAHSIPEIDNNKYGVLVAQKAMVTKRDNLSSFSLAEFESFLSGLKKKKTRQQ